MLSSSLTGVVPYLLTHWPLVLKIVGSIPAAVKEKLVYEHPANPSILLVNCYKFLYVG